MNPEKRSFVHRTDPRSKGLFQKLFGAFFSSTANPSHDPDHVYPSTIVHTNDVDRGKMKERTIENIEKELADARDDVDIVKLALQEALEEVAECERDLRESKKTVSTLEAELAVAKRIGTEFEKVA